MINDPPSYQPTLAYYKYRQNVRLVCVMNQYQVQWAIKHNLEALFWILFSDHDVDVGLPNNICCNLNACYKD
jgi:hypothetical protein